MARLLLALTLSILLGCERADLQSDNPPIAPATQPPIEDTRRELERPVEPETPKAPTKKPRRARSYPTEPPAETTEPPETMELTNPARACCRYCSKGKACGNSCIAASKTCHKRVGCACDL